MEEEDCVSLGGWEGGGEGEVPSLPPSPKPKLIDGILQPLTLFLLGLSPWLVDTSPQEVLHKEQLTVLTKRVCK